MAFYEPKDLIIDNCYKLTEFVENQKISAGEYLLVSVEDESQKMSFPILGFSKAKNRKADVFLKEAHAQFDSPTWRHAFRHDNRWDIYCPAGAITWNHSYVIISDACG